MAGDANAARKHQNGAVGAEIVALSVGPTQKGHQIKTRVTEQFPREPFTGFYQKPHDEASRDLLPPCNHERVALEGRPKASGGEPEIHVLPSTDLPGSWDSNVDLDSVWRLDHCRSGKWSTRNKIQENISRQLVESQH
jgi:hypothetical protein